MNVNMVVVRLGGVLVSFPMSGNGTLFVGSAFSSTYDIGGHQVSFVEYDPKTDTGLEVARFALSDNGVEHSNVIAKMILENVFQDAVKFLLNELQNRNVPEGSSGYIRV